MRKKDHILEKDIQSEIMEWLNKEGYFFWRQNNMPVYGMSGSGYMRWRSMPKFTPKGLPDIMIIHRGFFISFEVKLPKKKQSPHQIHMCSRILANGGYYHVVTSLKEAQDAMQYHEVNNGERLPINLPPIV